MNEIKGTTLFKLSYCLHARLLQVFVYLAVSNDIVRRRVLYMCKFAWVMVINLLSVYIRSVVNLNCISIFILSKCFTYYICKFASFIIFTFLLQWQLWCIHIFFKSWFNEMLFCGVLFSGIRVIWRWLKEWRFILVYSIKFITLVNSGHADLI